MALNFQLEFPTRRKNFEVKTKALLERAAKNLSMTFFFF